MADDDWRAQRAAQLAGTPFARPQTDPRLEDTLPINSPWIAPPKPRSAPVPAGGRPMYKTIAAAAAFIAVIVGFLIFRHDGRRRATPAIAATTVAPAPLAAPAPVPSPSPVPAPVSPPPAAIVAPAAPTVAAPSTTNSSFARSQPAPVTPRHAGRVDRAPKPAVSHAHPARKARTKPAAQSPGTPSSEEPMIAAAETPTATVRTRLPVCQPGVYSRAARPCRSSRDRFVRKPYYSK